MSKHVAVGYRVHVKPDLSETEKKASGIAGFIIPDVDKERTGVDSGVVVDIGPTAWADYGGTPWVSIGDHIVYARHSGYRVSDDVLVINDGDVVAKLED